MNGLVEGLRRGTFESYGGVQQRVDRSLVKVSKRLKEVFDCQATMLQQGVRSTTHVAARNVQKIFVVHPEDMNSGLSLIVARVKRNHSAKPGSSTTHSAKHELRHSRTKATFDSGSVLLSDTFRSSRSVILV